MGARRRILFFAESVTLAHVSRPFVLAKALDPRRFDVHFACSDDYRFVFESAPFTHWRIDSISGGEFMRALSSGSPPYSLATLNSYVRDDARVIDAVKPDFVVGDFRLSLSVSTRLTQTPYACLVNAHWSPFSDRPFPLPDVRLIDLVGLRCASALFWLMRPAIFAYHARPMNRLRRQYGLEPLASLPQVYSCGDYTFYTDVPSLAPTRHLPPSHSYLGPILWSPPMSLPTWWDDIPSNRPCVYLTLGSSGDINLLPSIVQAVARLPVTVLLSTAGRSGIDKLPPNVLAADYLPGDDVVDRADAVICSGGSATAYQALARGVPVVGLASNMDQHLTMAAIGRAGAGIHLRACKATPDRVREAVNLILDNEGYREAARGIAEEISQYDAPRIFSRYLENV